MRQICRVEETRHQKEDFKGTICQSVRSPSALMAFYIFYVPAMSDATMKFEISRRYIAKYNATCDREKKEKKKNAVLCYFCRFWKALGVFFMKIAVKLADGNTKEFFTRSSGSGLCRGEKNKKEKKGESIKSNKNIGHAGPMHLYRAS